MAIDASGREFKDGKIYAQPRYEIASQVKEHLDSLGLTISAPESRRAFIVINVPQGREKEFADKLNQNKDLFVWAAIIYGKSTQTSPHKSTEF